MPWHDLPHLGSCPMPSVVSIGCKDVNLLNTIKCHYPTKLEQGKAFPVICRRIDSILIRRCAHTRNMLNGNLLSYKYLVDRRVKGVWVGSSTPRDNCLTVSYVVIPTQCTHAGSTHGQIAHLQRGLGRTAGARPNQTLCHCSFCGWPKCYLGKET